MFSRGQLFVTPWAVDCLAPLSTGFLGKNIVVGCHFLIQESFLTQGPNLHLLHWKQIFLPLSHQGSPVEGVTKRQMLCDPSHLYEVPRVVKLLDPERKEVAATGWGEVIEERGEGELFNEYEFQFCRIK